MKFAIIAAGKGSRLAKEGIKTSKPLLQIGNERMIDRLIRIFIESGAESVNIIINEEMKDIRGHLQHLQLPVPLHYIIKSTPDSMRSFYELSPLLKGGRFCLTTVDTIFREEEFKSYIEDFKKTDAPDALMAVTDYIDDEKPLYIKTSADLSIAGFLDTFEEDVKYVSGGIYCLNEKVISLLEEAVGTGVSRMRNFQRMLIEKNLKVKAYPFSKIVDVDHVADIEKAWIFLEEEK
ncbi:MAG: NDP-sugar synthase [Bacteroides sp.]|nr:NDP-sugar synthase [Bacteroides sp.]